MLASTSTGIALERNGPRLESQACHTSAAESKHGASSDADAAGGGLGEGGLGDSGGGGCGGGNEGDTEVPGGTDGGGGIKGEVSSAAGYSNSAPQHEAARAAVIAHACPNPAFVGSAPNVAVGTSIVEVPAGTGPTAEANTRPYATTLPAASSA
eukprot:1406631-Prymnesium_polylepis.4